MTFMFKSCLSSFCHFLWGRNMRSLHAAMLPSSSRAPRITTCGVPSSLSSAATCCHVLQRTSSAAESRAPALTTMSNNDEDLKPWKRLYHSKAQEAQQEEPQQQQQHPEELTDLQQQLLTWYRKTCLVAGAGMAGAVWHWYSIGKHKQREVFIPPRAQALPPEVVAAWKKKAEMKIAMGTIGRQSLFITGIAALYFGVELGTGYYRDQYGDWSNTAVAGAVAGCYLGARAPSSMRVRTSAVGGLAGGMLGAVSGWCQQQLTGLAAAADASSNNSSSSSKTPG